MYIKEEDKQKCMRSIYDWESWFFKLNELELNKSDIVCDRTIFTEIAIKAHNQAVESEELYEEKLEKWWYGSYLVDEYLKGIYGSNDKYEFAKSMRLQFMKATCKHPIEWDKRLFNCEKIEKDYREITNAVLNESIKNKLIKESEKSDIWEKGLSKVFKKNNFYFVHPIYFLNHLDKAGLLEFNPYEGKRYEEIYNYDTKNMKPADEEKKYYIFEKAGEKKPYNSYYVKSNPGIATEWSSWGVKIKGNKVPFYAGITGFFNAQYLSEHPNYKEYWHEGVDFRGPAGTTVYSLIYGKVIRCGSRYSNGQTQGFILLQSLSDENLFYLALHVDKDTLLVKNGQDVTPEMPIGHTMLLKSSDGKDISHLHVSVIRLPKGTELIGNKGVITVNNKFPTWGEPNTPKQQIWKNMINPFNYEDSNTWQGRYK